MVATIHFHGIHQLGTPWSDGPAQITQCPLGALQTQEYRFKAYPPGTHYWHAHAVMDVADGLSGPIIIHPKEESTNLEYDDERMLFLQDFYSETGEQQRAGLDNFPFTWIGNPDSLLINGKGLAAACAMEGADPVVCLDTCNDTLAWLPTIEVEANTTYRIRIINSGQLIFQNVAIVGHNMTIVEIEGTIIETPITVANYDVAPGQRVSVLITTDQEPGSYLIETSVRERNITGLFGRAILQYASVEKSLPTVSPEHPLWNASDEGKAIEDSLLTLDPSSYPEAVALQTLEDKVERWVIVGTQNLKLDENGEPMQLRWACNNISDVKPSEPLIARAVRLARENGWPTNLGDTYLDVPQLPPTTWNYSDLIDNGPGPNLGESGTAVIRLKEGQVFEIVLQNVRALNGAAEFHPWHVHGHSFWVIGRGEGTYDAETDVATYNLENPLLRDTATLWPLGWTALRMVAQPGVWLFHCHLTSHMIMGMSFALVVEPEALENPPSEIAFCANLGNASLADSSNSSSPGADNKDGTAATINHVAFVFVVSLFVTSIFMIS
jgi:L-ascorbate oxidase